MVFCSLNTKQLCFAKKKFGLRTFKIRVTKDLLPPAILWFLHTGFQSQGVFLACTLSCLHAVPQIHLWCDTCWHLDSQRDSWAFLTYILVVMRHIHKHWWSWDLGQRLNPWTTVLQHSALTVADPGFSQGAPTLREGAPGWNWIKCSRKLHEFEKKFGHGGSTWRGRPPRSATDLTTRQLWLRNYSFIMSKLSNTVIFWKNII